MPGNPGESLEAILLVGGQGTRLRPLTIARIASGNELARGLRVWPEAEVGPAAIRVSTDA